MRDYVLEKICDIENWQASKGRRVWNWPVTVLSYLFLFVLLMVSKLLAIAGLVATLFIPANKTAKSSIIEVTDQENLDRILARSKNVLVDFWAPWCGPCMLMKPALQEITNRFGQDLIVVMVNVSQSKKLAQQYGIAGIPALLFFENGNLVHQHAGALSAEHLTQAVEQQFRFEKNSP